MLRYFTAGESHGHCLTMIIDGTPAGFPIDVAKINQDLWRRQQGYSCGGRMLIEKDEREDDHRAVLNFGHTVGHALEAVTGYTRFLHGEAVGVGMVKAAAISMQHGFCDEKDFTRIQKLVENAGLPSAIPADVRMQDLVQCMEVDKKSGSGKIKFVMYAGIGKTRFQWHTSEEILSALEN